MRRVRPRPGLPIECRHLWPTQGLGSPHLWTRAPPPYTFPFIKLGMGH